MKRTVSFLCAAVILVAGAALAQNRYQQQIVEQLERASSDFIAEGYEPIVWDDGTLEEDDTMTYSVNLQAGNTYALVAVCDEDCLDIDLAIFDGYDDLIVEDVEDDAFPIIEFEVTTGGEFTLDVEMFDCSAEYCYYGVALFEW